MQYTVPSTIPAIVFSNVPVAARPRCASALTNLASPKSSTFATPREVIITFALLMSRCTMPRSCASVSASATCDAMSSPSAGTSGPRATRADSVSPSTYSIARYTTPSSSPMS